MLMGTNDIAVGNTAKQTAGNVKLILDAFKKHDSSMPIVLCLVMPASAEVDRSAAQIKELNKLYVELAKKYPQVTVLDLWTLFANDQGDAKLEEFPDLLHPNDAGYAKWAVALRPVLVKLGLLEVEEDNLKP
jgi:lysophospholipase L1-like esterase